MTFSSEFIKQYQGICSEVDVIMKSICKELGNPAANDMEHGYTPTILQNWGKIKNQKVKLKDIEGHADIFLDRYAYTPSIV